MPSFVTMLGGTFDPIHHGHLRTALEIYERLCPDEVRLIPCHQPAHRGEPEIESVQRLEMVRLAIAGSAGLRVDDRELRRDGPSYSVDTLLSLRQELGESCSLALVIGTDALLGLQHWHRWRELLALAHVVVVRRPGWHLPDGHPLESWLHEHLTQEVETLRQAPAGKVLWQELTPLKISATQIRAALKAGQSPRYLLPDAVLAYIRKHGLYR